MSDTTIDADLEADSGEDNPVFATNAEIPKVDADDAAILDAFVSELIKKSDNPPDHKSRQLSDYKIKNAHRFDDTRGFAQKWGNKATDFVSSKLKMLVPYKNPQIYKHIDGESIRRNILGVLEKLIGIDEGFKTLATYMLSCQVGIGTAPPSLRNTIYNDGTFTDLAKNARFKKIQLSLWERLADNVIKQNDEGFVPTVSANYSSSTCFCTDENFAFEHDDQPKRDLLEITLKKDKDGKISLKHLYEPDGSLPIKVMRLFIVKLTIQTTYFRYAVVYPRPLRWMLTR